MTYKNALFINYGGIGDEILFLPTLKAFKEQYPNSKITLALENRSKSIKNLSSIIDETISVDIKAQGFKKYINVLKFIFDTYPKKFDCVISSGKNPLVAIILFLMGIKERIGYTSKTDFLLTKKVPLNENQYAAKMYFDLVKEITNSKFKNPTIDIPNSLKLPEELKEKEYICIHPGVSKMSISKNIYKCPNLNFWNNLVEGLLNKGKTVVLLGTKDDEDLINKILENKNIKENKNFINFFNKTKNIMEMALIMQKSKHVICVDSAPLHVAVGVGADTFAIFGPTNDEKLIPKENNIKLIINNCDCRPCLWHKRQSNCENSKCLDINPELILEKI